MKEEDEDKKESLFDREIYLCQLFRRERTNKNEVRINRKILIVEIFRLMIVIIVQACAFRIKKVMRKDVL